MGISSCVEAGRIRTVREPAKEYFTLCPEAGHPHVKHGGDGGVFPPTHGGGVTRLSAWEAVFHHARGGARLLNQKERGKAHLSCSRRAHLEGRRHPASSSRTFGAFLPYVEAATGCPFAAGAFFSCRLLFSASSASSLHFASHCKMQGETTLPLRFVGKARSSFLPIILKKNTLFPWHALCLRGVFPVPSRAAGRFLARRGPCARESPIPCQGGCTTPPEVGERPCPPLDKGGPGTGCPAIRWARGPRMPGYPKPGCRACAAGWPVALPRGTARAFGTGAALLRRTRRKPSGTSIIICMEETMFIGMILLGLLTFVCMVGLTCLCDRL